MSKRSRFLATSVSAFTTCIAARARARAAQFSYKLATVDPPDFPEDIRWRQMTEAIAHESDGRLDVRFFPGSQLGNADSLLAQVRLGSLEFVISGVNLYGAIVPVSQVFALGFTFPSSAQQIALFDGPFGAYMQRELMTKGVQILRPMPLGGYRNVMTTAKPLQTADDIAGVKIRTTTAPISVDFWRALGAAPTPVNNADLYTAVQTHLVDGVDGNLAGMEVLKLYEIQHCVSITKHQQDCHWLGANPASWQALPGDLQAIFQRNFAKAVTLERSDNVAIDVALVDKFQRRGVRVAANPDTASMRARLAPYYAKWKNELGSNVWGMLEAVVGKRG